ncbi:hypothetical protein G6O67_001841 [Ophiocordyceps sinensis]|uniref:Uncharacterized protein n=2 Tax=Ophiocordyceps sinensis TaxID=72228 RepID=A0A8H4PSW7_9HYPO|nr:hypothetical protein OCS_01284 [Ophiocordyceps sinensis CO18]KAF4509906.1 hypothetical protein G6O67_001841 [Ophiocordyceps sinensis]
MCVQHKVVATACGHTLSTYQENCREAAPGDGPCEGVETYMCFTSQYCDACLVPRAQYMGFGAAYSSLNTKQALNTYWTDAARRDGQAQLPEGGVAPRGVDEAGYAHWVKAMELLVEQYRPQRVGVGQDRQWHLSWAPGSSESHTLTEIAREAVERTLKVTPDYEGFFDKDQLDPDLERELRAEAKEKLEIKKLLDVILDNLLWGVPGEYPDIFAA